MRKYLYRMAGVDFTLIDGLEAMTVQNILSEVGLDPKRFPTVKQPLGLVYVLVKKLPMVKLKTLKLVPLSIVQPMLSVWLPFPSPKVVLL